MSGVSVLADFGAWRFHPPCPYVQRCRVRLGPKINAPALLHAVAEEGHGTRGAERLCISQLAVSKQLRELERSLGMALFHRLSKGIQLTEAGQLLLGYSRQLFALEAEAEQALKELRALKRGTLRIGASTTIG